MTTEQRKRLDAVLGSATDVQHKNRQTEKHFDLRWRDQKNWESNNHAYPHVPNILKHLVESHYINANYVLLDTGPTLGHFFIHRCYTQTIY